MEDQKLKVVRGSKGKPCCKYQKSLHKELLREK